MSKINTIQHYRGDGVPASLAAGEFAIDVSRSGNPVLLVSEDGNTIQSLSMCASTAAPSGSAYQSQLWLDTSVSTGGIDLTYQVANNLTTPYSGEFVLDAYQGKILNDAVSAVTTALSSVWESIYPVGSIYMSINNTSPETLFGGSWEQISEGRALFGAGTCDGITYTADTEVNRGLPNITGMFKLGYQDSTGPALIVGAGSSGALYSSRENLSSKWIPGTSANTNIYQNTINLNASRSSNIYGSSSTVQPNAYVVYMWKRTA